MSRQELSNREKRAIAKRDEYRCRYCGTQKKPFEFDHVYPVIRGGETSLENIVLACKNCNRRKHSTVGIWPKPIGYFNEVIKDKRADERRISLSWLLLIMGLIAILQSKVISSVGIKSPETGMMFIVLGIGLIVAAILKFIFT